MPEPRLRVVGMRREALYGRDGRDARDDARSDTDCWDRHWSRRSRAESGRDNRSSGRLARRRSLGRAKEPDGQQRVPVLGAAETDAGRLVLFGDSGCLDEAHRQGGPCFPLLHAALAFAAAGKRDRAVFPDAARLDEDHARGAAPIDHPADAMLRKYSRHYAGAAHGPPPYDARPAELPRVGSAEPEKKAPSATAPAAPRADGRQPPSVL